MMKWMAFQSCSNGRLSEGGATVYWAGRVRLHSPELTLDEAKAKFDSGLLTITMPFQKPAKPKEITIE